MMNKFKYWATWCTFSIIAIPVLIIHVFIALPIYYTVKLIVRIEGGIGSATHGVLDKMNSIVMRLKREAYDEN